MREINKRKNIQTNKKKDTTEVIVHYSLTFQFKTTKKKDDSIEIVENGIENLPSVFAVTFDLHRHLGCNRAFLLALYHSFRSSFHQFRFFRIRL